MILDTSVVFKWYIKGNEADTTLADLILKRFIDGIEIIRAPSLLIYELANALSHSRFLTSVEIQRAIDNFFNLGIEIIEVHQEDINKALFLAREYKITVYDAIYIALTERFQESLITANPKHQQGIMSKRVINLANYV